MKETTKLQRVVATPELLLEMETLQIYGGDVVVNPFFLDPFAPYIFCGNSNCTHCTSNCGTNRATNCGTNCPQFCNPNTTLNCRADCTCL